jgi:uncharacterized integral membrane protein
MRRLVILFVLVPLAVIAIVLSVANRETVSFSFDPFGVTDPPWAIRAPLFVLLFATLAIGVLTGGVATWLRQHKWRRAARGERANAQRLRQEVERLRERPTVIVPAIAGPDSERDAA